MSEPLQLIISNDGVTICGHGEEDGVKLAAAEEVTLGKRLAEYFVTRGISGREVILFISEDLLFYKTITLPLNTQDLDEAISYQIDMLVPFGEDDLLYSFVASRQKEYYRVTLACASRQLIEPCLQEIAAADIRIAGLHPEFQRYLSKNTPKGKWALLLEGRLTRALVFDSQNLVERMLFPMPVPPDELAGLCGTELLYHVSPPEGTTCFIDAAGLLTGRGSIKDFNMLPASYRRPEFSKFFIIVLLFLNLFALIGFIGGREYQMRDYAARIEAEISKVAPLARESMRLRQEERQLSSAINEFLSMQRNPDLIGFFEKLTRELPATAYLDQMRMDSKTRAIHIQGYTDDIGELTGKLQAMGEAKLKSTSRRKNKIYFNVEVSLP